MYAIPAQIKIAGDNTAAAAATKDFTKKTSQIQQIRKCVPIMN